MIVYTGNDVEHSLSPLNFNIMLMLWLFVGPTGIYLLDLFCSGIQFYLLLSPYLCFISLSYLDFYILGDDALIS